MQGLVVLLRPQVSMSMLPFANNTTYLCKASCSSPDPRFPCLCFPLKPLKYCMQVLMSLQTACYLPHIATT
jgi:hypothetical protein